ncbi:MAG: hypothetical protein R2879_00790 [Saprospiraceae bacterium]
MEVVLQSAAQQILLFLVLTLPDPSITGTPTYTSTCGGAAVTYNDVGY